MLEEGDRAATSLKLPPSLGNYSEKNLSLQVDFSFVTGCMRRGFEQFVVFCYLWTCTDNRFYYNTFFLIFVSNICMRTVFSF